MAILVAVSALVFLGTSALPGDAATAALGRDATPALVAGLRKEYGLDRPLLERYGDWLAGAIRGDLGRSLPNGIPVTTVIGDKVRNTAVLTALTVALLVPLAIILGMVSALRPGRVFDQVVGGSTLALIATPEFVIGSILTVVASTWLGWLPPVSLVDPSRSILSNPTILVLPVLTLLAATLAHTIRMIRASMIEVLDSPFVEMARLKGVPERRVLLRHALPNSIGPTVQIIALNIPWLVGGIVIVEAVFEYRGMGLALVGAVSSRDLPTVQALALLIAALIICVNVLADLCVILLNPRARKMR